MERTPLQDAKQQGGNHSEHDVSGRCDLEQLTWLTNKTGWRHCIRQHTLVCDDAASVEQP
jgi:hypothetical protein